jgi:diguanylate cyclase (GGDEF)-like protein
MFDIDHSKAINDRHGHLAGDRILAAVGRLLERLLRASDLRCRYGGDEFLVILHDTPELGASQVAAGLPAEIGKLEVTPGSADPKISASLGVAVADAMELEATGLIARADEALYEAKRAGRNRFAVASSKTGFLAK